MIFRSFVHSFHFTFQYNPISLRIFSLFPFLKSPVANCPLMLLFHFLFYIRENFLCLLSLLFSSIFSFSLVTFKNKNSIVKILVSLILYQQFPCIFSPLILLIFLISTPLLCLSPPLFFHYFTFYPLLVLTLFNSYSRAEPTSFLSPSFLMRIENA